MKRKFYRIFFILLLVAITFTSQQYINADLGEGLYEWIFNLIVDNNGNEFKFRYKGKFGYYNKNNC